MVVGSTDFPATRGSALANVVSLFSKVFIVLLSRAREGSQNAEPAVDSTSAEAKEHAQTNRLISLDLARSLQLLDSLDVWSLIEVFPHSRVDPALFHFNQKSEMAL